MSRSIARILMIAVACIAVLALAGTARAAATGANPLAWMGMANNSGPMASQSGLGAASSTPAATAPTGQDADGDGDGSAAAENDQNSDQNSDQAQAQETPGVIASIDPSGSTFTLTTTAGVVTVAVTSATQFDDGLSGLASLQPGMNVTVEGVPQAAGQALATEVAGSNDADAAEGAEVGSPDSGQ